MIRRDYLLAGCSLAMAILAASPALADEPAPDGADPHKPASTDIIVTAPIQRDRFDILSGASVVQGAALAESLRPTIGETLEHLPGVSATSFGPAASRPILRGLQGERVRVLTDGIGSIDVSNTSVDHAVVVNPLLAERVEVLRGPTSLLFGSAAIGGVVNVIDRRIPRSVPDEPIHVDAIASYGSAANERSIASGVDVPVSDKIIIHADASYLKTGDLHVGGYVLSPLARQQALASSKLPVGLGEDEPIDFAASAALKDKLPNSAAKTWTVGLGAALVTDSGNLGFSYSHYDSLYGIPVRYATLPGEEQEAPRLDLKQDRVDVRAEVQTGGGILKAIRFRAGYASYRHFELEENGDIGTAFYSKGLEGRLELVQTDRGAWTGATGVQYFARDFNVVGEEAFLPRNSSQQLGLFTLQQLAFGPLKVEAGARYEHSTQEAKPGADQPQFFGGTRSFDTFSGSVGASYGLSDNWRVGVNALRTVRAPSAEELFANGPHAGTQAFEIGDPDFKPERSYGVEAVLRGKGEGFTVEASVYHNWFTNFIYDRQSGEIEDGLPVYQSAQGKARYYGFELQGTATLATFGQARIVADGLADYVHANIESVGPAPRIPPLRLLGGLGVQTPKIDGRVEVEWTDKQSRLAEFETPTDSYTMVNAELNIRPWGTERPVSFVVSANNIFDVDARRSASFLKDFAPLAGRDIRATAKLSF